MTETLPIELNKPIYDITEYIAGYVIRSLRLNCTECTDFLAEPRGGRVRDDTLIGVKDKGGLIQPCAAVTDVCVVTERVL